MYFKSVKKLYLIALCIFFVTSAKAQTIKNNLIVMGTVDSVYSKILKENRKVWVYMPAGADMPAHAGRRYPVVYLLDGDAHFASVTGMVQQLSQVNGNKVCPEMIVVGILNTDRMRDLTPGNMPKHKTSGGGENFTEFMEKELIPHIDSIYPTAPYKMFIGHSLGGLIVVNALVNHPEMFNAYVAIDPSVWWNNKKLLNHASDVLKEKIYNGKSLYLGIANTMPAGMDTSQVRKDTTDDTEHIRAILTLKDMLQRDTSADGLNFAYKYYNGDNHSMVPLITTYDALHFIFRFYSSPRVFMSKLFDPKSKADVVGLIEAHYRELSKQMGYTILPPESDINSYGYSSMSKMPDKAFALFSMNIRNYPESANVYDSMGDYYSSKADKANAVIYYNKALKLYENPYTRAKLNKVMAVKDLARDKNN